MNFTEFYTNKSFAKTFVISEIEVEEKYDLNFNKLRVIDRGFKDAFNDLSQMISHFQRNFQNPRFSQPLRFLKEFLESYVKANRHSRPRTYLFWEAGALYLPSVGRLHLLLLGSTGLIKPIYWPAQPSPSKFETGLSGCWVLSGVVGLLSGCCRVAVGLLSGCCRMTA